MRLGGWAAHYVHEFGLPLTLNATTYIVHWDGSFSPQGAGIGVTIESCTRSTIHLAVPVSTTDAARTEALGPAFAALVLSLLPVGEEYFYGDSASVVG